MGAVREYFSAIGRSVVSIGDGLAVTFSYLFRKPVTIQYPDRTEKPVVAMLPERSRGILEVDIDTCTACGLCEKTCPIGCITVKVEKVGEAGQRMLTAFDIDIGKCMYCGLCTEVCSTGSIRHSHEFEGAMGRWDRLTLHFVGEPKLPAKPRKGEAAPEKPLGSIARHFLADPFGPPPPPGGGIKWGQVPAPQPKPAAEPKPEVKAEAKPETKPEAKPVAKEEAKAEVKAEAKPEAKPEARAEGKPEAKVEKAAAKAEPEA